jgi:tripeptidyl-peptidase-1
MFAPSEESVQAVREWLVTSGIEDDAIVHSDNKGWLAFDIPAWQAEDLFQTEYHEHVHSTSGQVRVGCDEYAWPWNIFLRLLNIAQILPSVPCPRSR